jgi:hypothetical protein
MKIIINHLFQKAVAPYTLLIVNKISFDIVCACFISPLYSYTGMIAKCQHIGYPEMSGHNKSPQMITTEAERLRRICLEEDI